VLGTAPDTAGGTHLLSAKWCLVAKMITGETEKLVKYRIVIVP
jgi:hypothetical protein